MTAARSDTPYILTVPRHFARLLLAIALVLIAIHLALQFDRFHGQHVPWQIDQLFDLDEEQAVPNWFSSAILAIGSLLFAAIGSRARRVVPSDAPRWFGMSIAMLYLSFDEVAGVHETVNSLSPITWTIPFGLLAIVLGFYFLPFMMRQRRATMWGLVVAGVVYVGAAAGVEFVTSRLFMGPEPKTFSYALLTALEEGGEMMGAILTIRTLLRHMEAEAGARAVELEVS